MWGNGFLTDRANLSQLLHGQQSRVKPERVQKVVEAENRSKASKKRRQSISEEVSDSLSDLELKFGVSGY